MSMSEETRSAGWTRREALGILGMGAAAAALPDFASAAAPAFPRGAIIRTILKDYAPEDLAGGATLFHEHMSFAPDFLPRWIRYATETAAANGQRGQAAGRGAPPPAPTPPAAPSGPFFMQDLDLMSDEMAIAKREGISCIVDGGHADMGRDLNFLRQLSTK